MKHTNIEITDFGNRVVCDCCGEDWTERTESGGFLFLSKAYCPACAPTAMARIVAYNEERHLRGFCPPDLSFKDWVLKLRDGNNTVKVITFEDK